MKKSVKTLLSLGLVMLIFISTFSTITAEERLNQNEIQIKENLEKLYFGDIDHYTVYDFDGNIVTNEFYIKTKADFINQNYGGIVNYMKDNRISTIEIDYSSETSNSTRAEAPLNRSVNHTFIHNSEGGSESGSIWLITTYIRGSYLYYPSTDSFGDNNVNWSYTKSNTVYINKYSFTNSKSGTYLKFKLELQIEEKNYTQHNYVDEC